MSNKRTAAKEFEFVRDKLKEIARLIVESKNNIAEACFMMGALLSICHENINYFTDMGDKKDE